jgi:hypothetical protein
VALDALLHAIKNARAAGSRGGCFDVMAWRDDHVLFLEAKRRNHDRVRESQRRWLNGAMSVGLAADALMAVEWESSEAKPG